MNTINCTAQVVFLY